MKKAVFLLVALCLGAAGVAYSFDYDRVTPGEVAGPSNWFTLTENEQLVSIPHHGVITFVGNEDQVDIGPVIIKMERPNGNPGMLKVSKITKEGATNEVTSIQFFLEENGEKLISVDGNAKESVISYMVKMVWVENNTITGRYVASVY